MRAIVVSELGGPEVMVAAEREDLAAGPGEILVRVAAAGVNFIDIYQRSGIGAYTQRTPYTPGGEGAGTVLAVGDGVTDFAAGDGVAWSTGQGSYAEQTALPAQVFGGLWHAVRDCSPPRAPSGSPPRTMITEISCTYAMRN